jgi:hypothetical protein
MSFAESSTVLSSCSIITVRRRLSRASARFEKLARRDPALAQRFGGPVGGQGGQGGQLHGNADEPHVRQKGSKSQILASDTRT